MKQYRITIDGRVYEVQIDDPQSRPVTARLAGVAFSVDVETMRPIKDEESDDQATSIDVSSTVATSSAVGTATAENAPSKPGSETTITGQQSLPAPIPGVVTSVAVRPGQSVEHGDELLTIEAMKMFNVIRSPWSGTVATVHVGEGKRVSQGEPLITFRPA